jgi:uncharacterized membrane protein YdjX (TVP38/TMEM64 family)
MPAIRTSFSIIYLIFLSVFPVLFSSFSAFYLYKYQDLLYTFDYIDWSILFVCTSFTMALALTPTTFIAICSGYFLNDKAMYFVIPAYLLASIIGFYSSRLIDQGNLLQQVSKKQKVKDFIYNLKTKSFSFVVLSRISPIFPFALMNFVLAALKIRLRTFVLAGFIGMLPRTLLFIWVGSQAKGLVDAINNPNKSYLAQLSVIILVVASVFGFIYLISRSIRRS